VNLNHMIKSNAYALSMLMVLVISTVLAVLALQPPEVISTAAPPDRFSAARVWPFIVDTSQEPHYTGSVSNRRVRDRIVNDLKAAGLQPEIQRTVIADGYQAGQIENVVTRLPGTANTRAILLIAHYDSTNTAPGAQYDGLVGAGLEALRALKAGAPLKNDVIFLATDGEELGMFGALAFMQQHRWMSDVGFVIVPATGGLRGGSVMTRAGRNNGWLMPEFARVTPYGLGTSFMNDLMGSVFYMGTDFTPFFQQDYPGFNFTFSGERVSNHSALDTPENLDLHLIQQSGDNTLALLRHFGNLDLSEDHSQPDATFFNVWGWRMITYPYALNLPLAIGVGMALAVIAINSFRRGELNLRKLLGSIGVWLTIVIASALLGQALYMVVDAVVKLPVSPGGGTHGENIYLAGFIMVVVAWVATAYGYLRLRFGPINLFIGASVVWLLAAVVMCFVLPGMAYLLTWPLLFNLIGWAVSRHLTNWARLFTLMVGALPGVILFVNFLYTMYAMGVGITSAEGLGGVTNTAIIACITTLLIAVLSPQLEVMLTPHRGWLPGLSLATGLSLIVVASLLTAPSDRYPRPTALLRYALNADTQQAVWFAPTWGNLDDWSKQVLTGDRGKVDSILPEVSSLQYRTAAPIAPLAPPEVRVLANRVESGTRHLTLNLSSPRGGTDAVMMIFDPLTDVRSISWAGQPLKLSHARSVVLVALPAVGADLELQVVAASPVKFSVRDQSRGLPQLNGQPLVTERPPHLMPFWANHLEFVTDTTLVVKSFELAVQGAQAQ
jgi:hypothetical protein